MHIEHLFLIFIQEKLAYSYANLQVGCHKIIIIRWVSGKCWNGLPAVTGGKGRSLSSVWRAWRRLR